MAECRITTITDENFDGMMATCRRFAAEAPVYEGMAFDEAGTAEFLGSFYGQDKSPYAMGFVSMLEDKVAGFLLVTAYKHPCLHGRATCDELMYIHPELRGLGIGNVLVGEYKEWAASMNADLVLLGSSSGINADFAEKFYSSNGFEPCGVLAKLGELDVRRENESESS
jgi:GNAT superfamily N-acetyltransferase